MVSNLKLELTKHDIFKTMTETFNLAGFIKGITYQTFLEDELDIIPLCSFDINEADPSGLIQAGRLQVAYSKWVSPKRTRSYPFARIYNTYNSCKAITVIPVIKDEGKDGDRDRIQYSTVSWMNLLNVYIVLAYYETAEKSNKPRQKNKQKLSQQKFDNEFVTAQIQEILKYRQSALHWNKNLFEERFTDIAKTALDCYDSINKKTGVAIHSRTRMEKDLNKIIVDFEEFKNISLKGSQNASKREALTRHQQEYLISDCKGTFIIENYLGGIYFLTPDEIFCEDDRYVIQESKNSSKRLFPAKSDIQDGLFKLILYSNLDRLTINGKEVSFVTRLKLTGNNISGSIIFPHEDENKLDLFLANNSFTKAQKVIIKKLSVEAKNNNLEIEISANS